MDKDSTVLEFYCGIGGLHHAYCMSGGKGKVVAYDISKSKKMHPLVLVYEVNVL